MTRSHVLLLLALAAAVPAAAGAAGSYFAAPEGPCFSAGTTGYRLTTKADADYTIRIDSMATQPDLTLQVVDDPVIADFILADGVENAESCDRVSAIRTIRLDPSAQEPDLTIAIAPKGGRGLFKIYARSAEFTAEHAAALFAVMWNATRKRVAAAH